MAKNKRLNKFNIQIYNENEEEINIEKLIMSRIYLHFRNYRIEIFIAKFLFRGYVASGYGF